MQEQEKRLYASKNKRKRSFKQWAKDNKKAIPIFLIVYVVFFAQVWLPIGLGWILDNSTLLNIGLAIEAFWAPPWTPGIPICIAITTGIVRFVNKRKTKYNIVERYCKIMGKITDKKFNKLLLIYTFEKLDRSNVKLFDYISTPLDKRKPLGDYDFLTHTPAENENYLLKWQRNNHILLKDYETIEEAGTPTYDVNKVPILIRKLENIVQ